jgi:hypothetical protein
MSKNTCLFCETELISNNRYKEHDGFVFECKICGTYKADDWTVIKLKNEKYLYDTHIFSGLTKHSNLYDTELVINKDNIDSLQNSPLIPKDYFDSLDKIIMYIFQKSNHAADLVEINRTFDYPIAFSIKEQEFSYFLEVLQNNFKWILNIEGDKWRLTEKGWKELNRIKTEKKDTTQIFVAMSFDKKYKIIWKNGYSTGIEETGYISFRVDEKEHNDRIDDEIIAGINASCCVVADATDKNAGVYYEAGYAKGLGIPVIWTCKREYFEEESAHFDTRQYNHILWDDSEDLRRKLISRIKATLPLL